MASLAEDDFRHLGPIEAGFAAALRRPRLLVWLALGVLVAMAWVYLVVIATALGVGGTFGSLGPGMGWLGAVLRATGLEGPLFALLSSNGWLAALVAVCSVAPATWGPADVAMHLSMWLAMGTAMMLPTAAPMIRTYAEIADTAAAGSRRVVSPLVLAAGYLAVWSAFAAAATALTWGLGVFGLYGAGGAPLAGWLGVGVLAVAGAYQFTGFKAACLVRCANPFPILFANWTERPGGVFRLGLRQGLHCLGCCWAMMLVMFAAGVMNLVWIAVLAGVMTAEKMIGARWFSHAVGAVFIVWAAVAAAGLAGWPA